LTALDNPQRLKAMTTLGKPKPFSMIREFHLADWFTLGSVDNRIQPYRWFEWLK